MPTFRNRLIWGHNYLNKKNNTKCINSPSKERNFRPCFVCDLTHRLKLRKHSSVTVFDCISLLHILSLIFKHVSGMIAIQTQNQQLLLKLPHTIFYISQWHRYFTDELGVPSSTSRWSSARHSSSIRIFNCVPRRWYPWPTPSMWTRYSHAWHRIASSIKISLKYPLHPHCSTLFP